MGEQTGKALWARPTFWKSALLIAPLAGTALFITTGTNAQTSGSTSPPNPPAVSTTVVPKPAPVAARSKGPKLRDKVDRVTGPSPTTDPATPAQTATPVAPIDAPDAARRGGPKGGGRDKIDTGRTTAATPSDAPVEDRRKEGPKGDVDHGRTDATPAPDSAPVEEPRRVGPKGAGESGRIEAPPAPDTQPAGRGAKPKGAGGHGRTATTPLIIGALGAAAVLVVVVSRGNDRPASP